LTATAASVEKAGRRDAIEAMWAFFVSLKLTLYLLVGLAAASALGTFVSPTPGDLQELRQRLGEGALFEVSRALELNDLFHSWWFTLMLWALSLNLIACTLERLPRVWQLAMRSERRLTDQAIRERRHVVRMSTRGSLAAEVARVEAAMRTRGFAPAIEKDGGTVFLFGERGKMARFGAHVTHLGLLVILAGGIAGRLGGAEGLVEVPEIEGSFDSVPVRTANGSFPKRLGFTVAVEDFRLKSFVGGQPRQYESDLAIYQGEELVARRTISVNHPMHHGGWSFYQASYQRLPDENVATVEFIDRLNGERRPLRLAAEQAATMDDGVSFGLLEYEPDHAGAGPAIHLGREEDGLLSDFWVFQAHPGFDLNNREDRWGVDFTGLDPLYLTGIQAVKDPGADVVFVGCVLLAIGLAQSFYRSHRRIWARVDSREIVVAGSAHRSPQAFGREFAALEAALRAG
jgi:cytochrome c biogenesis protein